MCAGDDRNCPEFELHRQKLLDQLDAERRTRCGPSIPPNGFGEAAATDVLLLYVGPVGRRPTSRELPNKFSG
jgi:hypothetical protein